MNLCKARLLGNNGAGTQTQAGWLQQACFFSRMLYIEWPMWYNKTHPTRTTIVEVSPQLTHSVANYMYHALNMMLKMGQGCIFPR